MVFLTDNWLSALHFTITDSFNSLFVLPCNCLILININFSYIFVFLTIILMYAVIAIFMRFYRGHRRT